MGVVGGGASVNDDVVVVECAWDGYTFGCVGVTGGVSGSGVRVGGTGASPRMCRCEALEFVSKCWFRCLGVGKREYQSVEV